MNFNVAGRQQIFRYALFANQFAGPTTSTCTTLPCPSRRSGIAHHIPGVDPDSVPEFLITLGCRDCEHIKIPGGTVEQQAGTFMHELGHTLGLQHGGTDSVHRKPNYLSVMSYNYQMVGVPKPFTNPLTTTPTQRSFDYSRLELPKLDELILNESAGISDPFGHLAIWNKLTNTNPSSNQCLEHPNTFYRLFYPSAALDWSCDGTKEPAPVIADINGDGICVAPGPNKTLESSAQFGDVVINQTIVAEPISRTCHSAASGDDVQIADVGSVQERYLRGAEDWSKLIYNADGHIGVQSLVASAQRSSIRTVQSFTTLASTTPASDERPVDQIFDFLPQALVDEELTAP
jgi:hypothetical protein